MEKLGFKAVIQSGIILHVQDALEVNFEMTLGSASESVTVAGESFLLDTESTVSTVVEQRKANELPLNGQMSLGFGSGTVGDSARQFDGNSDRRESIRMGQLPGERGVRKPECRVSGRTATKHWIHQSADLSFRLKIRSRSSKCRPAILDPSGDTSPVE